jgi:hypothetical protein
LLTWIKATASELLYQVSMWQPITSAPYGSDLELSVIEREVTHVLAFPCRRDSYGWIDAATQRRVEVRPTHWRPWSERDAA